MRCLHKKNGKQDIHFFWVIFIKKFDIYIEDNHIFLKYIQFQVDPFISF